VNMSMWVSAPKQTWPEDGGTVREIAFNSEVLPAPLGPSTLTNSPGPTASQPHGKKKLSTCDRDAIRAWIREGAKNN
jgi:hypothetical protein